MQSEQKSQDRLNEGLNRQTLLQQNQSNSVNSSKIMGVHGKYMWPIRITSFLIVCIVVGIVVFYNTSEIRKMLKRYHLYTTPPEFFFNIQYVIYSLLVIISLYNLVANKWSPRTHVLFAFSNFLNMAWFLIFQIGTIATNLICFFIAFFMVIFTFATWKQMGNIPDKEFTWIVYAIRNSIAFYLGWIICAANLNWGILQRYTWGIPADHQMVSFWILTSLCIAGVTLKCLSKFGKKGFFSCFCLLISATWAFVGAAITANGCSNGELDLC